MTTSNPPMTRLLFAYLRSNARTRSTCSDYARYQTMKEAWCDLHPDATSTQYDAAMNRIARECGV